MKNLIAFKSLLMGSVLFLFAFLNKNNSINKPTIEPLILVTDETWEVSKSQTVFGEGPLSINDLSAAHLGLKGGSAAAVVANIYGGSTLIKDAKPIWLTKKASSKWESRQFKKVFMLRNNLIKTATIKINCDDAARLYINGQLISNNKLSGNLNSDFFSSKTFSQLSAYFYDQIFDYDVKPYLKAGALNTILVEVASEPVDNGHAYLCAKLKVDFIEKTIAIKSDIEPVIKPKIKEEKKPAIIVKKAFEKVVIAPKIDIKETPQLADNEAVVNKKPIQETTPTVFNSSNDIDVKKLKIGDIFELGNIYFKADDYQLNSKSQETLLELATFLNANKSVKIEIGGHTNLLPTNEYAVKLSRDRAKSVMDFLIEKGVNASNLSFKGYGKIKPKLMDKTVEANLKNQRVEVKILAK
jgi:outer membrane protein OmpA-like peptidoglycan-associated protein